MKINTDTFLKMGDSHRECEDYIIRGMDPVPYIILADGCSSSNRTEMGARILCHLAKQYLIYRTEDIFSDSIDYKKMGSWIIHNAEMTIRQLGLPLACLDSTLIISYYIDNFLHVFMYGDGEIIMKDSEGNLSIHTVEFTNNSPYYLSYKIDPFRDDLYYQNKNSMNITTNKIYPERNYEDSRELAYDAVVKFSMNVAYWKTLFICSDGIRSFMVKDPRIKHMVDPVEFIDDMMNFKNFKGEFLKRRLKRAIKNIEDNGIVHSDDLSIGAYLRMD